jgi:hypothetical protein
MTSGHTSTTHPEEHEDAYNNSDEESTDDDMDFMNDDDDDDDDTTTTSPQHTVVVSWLPEIVVPGPFVVLQGSVGDGMANTIDRGPNLPSDDDERDRRATRTTRDTVARGRDEDDVAMDPPEDVPHVAPLPLGRLASSTAIHPFVRRGVVGPVAVAGSAPEGSFVVVEEDEDSTVASQLYPADATAIEEWRIHCLEKEARQQQDWKESLQQCPSRLQDHIMMTADNATTTTTTTTAWWRNESHQVAILRDVPTKLRDGGVVRQPIGALAPGTTVMARSIVHLDATTLQRLPVLPLRMAETTDHDDRSGAAGVYSRGQRGVIQLVQVETIEGRTGFACLSLEGYPLLAPGLPASYLNPEVWLWRVTCPAGAFVRRGLDLSSQHRDTVPYGSLVRVTHRCINNQGLSRLRTHGTIPIGVASQSEQTDGPMQLLHERHFHRVASEERQVDGWCSELLNPLSGQRGIIAQPLPFPVPAIYRVTLPIGYVHLIIHAE